MTAMTTARRLLAEALAIADDKIPDDARIGMLEQWDSLAHTRMLLALEERLGKPLDAEEAVAIESLADIAAVLTKHG
ncbi:MAG: acyl carrier protein [Alphaproteobacteria bacterium]|nr:acyl carrier protein [Alphaproteobacteria bacterium]